MWTQTHKPNPWNIGRIVTILSFGLTSITLTALAIAAIAGILLNAILPGNDYEFGKNPAGDSSRGVYVMNTDGEEGTK